MAATLFLIVALSFGRLGAQVVSSASNASSSPQQQSTDPTYSTIGADLTIEVFAFVNAIGNPQPESNTIIMDITFTLVWTSDYIPDEVDFHPHLNHTVVTQDVTNFHDIFFLFYIPLIEIENAVGESQITLKQGRSTQLAVHRSGKRILTTRLRPTLKCFLQFSEYPFDQQHCDIRLTGANPSNKLEIKWLRQGEFFAADVSADITSVHEFSVDDEVEAGNCTERGNSKFLNVLMHGMLVIIAGFSFWIDHKAVGARISLAVTTLLTISSMTSAIRRNLPKIEYETLLDVWLFSCWLFIFVALLEFCVVNSYALSQSDGDTILVLSAKPSKEMGNRSQRIDRISRVAHPAAFLLFTIVYFAYVVFAVL